MVSGFGFQVEGYEFLLGNPELKNMFLIVCKGINWLEELWNIFEKCI